MDVMCKHNISLCIYSSRKTKPVTTETIITYCQRLLPCTYARSAIYNTINIVAAAAVNVAELLFIPLYILFVVVDC